MRVLLFSTLLSLAVFGMAISARASEYTALIEWVEQLPQKPEAQTIEALRRVLAFHRYPHAVGSELRDLQAELSAIPDWDARLWPIVATLAQHAETPRAHPRLREADFPSRDCIEAFRDRDRCLPFLYLLLESLTQTQTKRAIRLIGPLLESPGEGTLDGDVYEPSVSDLAARSMLTARIQGFQLVGSPPEGAGMDAWRRWWQQSGSQYGPPLKLPYLLSESDAAPRQPSTHWTTKQWTILSLGFATLLALAFLIITKVRQFKTLSQVAIG